jgi:SAM-dependent methyltransferase
MSDFPDQRSDAFGRILYDHWQGVSDVREIIERDDGNVDTSLGPSFYFARFEDWPAAQQTALDFVHGRVLDIGCGAGRVVLHLQEHSYEAVGIDVSPLALEVCRLRGVRDCRLLSITGVNSRLGEFDSIVMFGNNFGLFGNFRRARWLLRRWRGVVRTGGRILAQTLDPYQTDDPVHLEYHARNRARGRMGGQVRLRVRYKNLIGPWFDYLFASRDELRAIVDQTGWHIAGFIDSERGNPGYIAILEKD